MTRPGHDPHGQDAHRWLTRHQYNLIDGLDGLLDVEAGLREILIQSRHTTAVDDLDTVLDTEAGLAAILPPAAHVTSASTHDHTSATDLEELLRTLSPAERMALRNHPGVKEASYDLTSAFAHVRVFAHDLDFDRNRARARALVRARNLVRDLARDLTRRLDHDLDLTLAAGLTLDRLSAHALDRARGLARGLDRDLSRVRTRAHHRARARDVAHDLDLALASAADLTHSLDLTRARARAADLTRALDHAYDLDRILARDLNHSLTRTRDRDRVAGRALDRASAHDLERVRVVIFEVRTAEVRRAIGLALRREPPALDEDSLYTLLDDFTTANLSDTNLTSVDLSGVHWSEHNTQWPPTIDVENLKTRSDETPPGSGIWIVRSGTATIRNLAEL
ncbi:hypothetical protein ACIF8T_40330 [Streptomyces sp. NPDC085946]|uniref:hypothetical protein n=1 Tax=Streptomyces sp. NPDC085946 TaxID=3365744 RepID=UPI0037CD5115